MTIVAQSINAESWCFLHVYSVTTQSHLFNLLIHTQTPCLNNFAVILLTVKVDKSGTCQMEKRDAVLIVVPHTPVCPRPVAVEHLLPHHPFSLVTSFPSVLHHCLSSTPNPDCSFFQHVIDSIVSVILKSN